MWEGPDPSDRSTQAAAVLRAADQVASGLVAAALS